MSCKESQDLIDSLMNGKQLKQELMLLREGKILLKVTTLELELPIIIKNIGLHIYPPKKKLMLMLKSLHLKEAMVKKMVFTQELLLVLL